MPLGSPSAFELLTASHRPEHARHRTLRAAVDWSYSLLEEPERELFDRLSVFAGGWMLEEATAVCAGGSVALERVVHLMASLVEKSMIVAPTGPGAGRYGMLETLRQYGTERLSARGDLDRLRRAHAEHFTAMAERANVGLRGPYEVEWVRRLQAGMDNLREAHSWCRSHGEADLALRLSTALHRFALWQANDEILTFRRPAVLARPAPAAVEGRALVHVLPAAGRGLRAWHGRGPPERERGQLGPSPP